MSFALSLSEARSTISMVQDDDGATGHARTSPILSGVDTPGGAAMKAPAGSETQMVGRLRHGIKTPKTRTDKLTRKYAAS